LSLFLDIQSTVALAAVGERLNHCQKLTDFIDKVESLGAELHGVFIFPYTLTFEAKGLW